MSYVKWILGGAAIIICTVIAYKLSEKFRLRQKFYNDFYLFNKRMCDEMSFTRNSLLSVLASFDAQTPFQRLLNEYRRSLTERTPFSCAEIWFLKEEEKRLTEEYFAALGKTDARTQMNFLKTYDANLKTSADAALSDKKKYVAMYIKLGLLTGIAVLILIL